MNVIKLFFFIQHLPNCNQFCHNVFNYNFQFAPYAKFMAYKEREKKNADIDMHDGARKNNLIKKFSFSNHDML